MKNKNERLAYRLGGILERLNAGERISVNDLAETYGVTPRTIQRDIAERLAFLEDKFLEKGPGYYRLDKAKLGHLCQADIERFSRFSSVQDMFPKIDQRFYQEQLIRSIQVKGFQYEDIKPRQRDFDRLQQAIEQHRRIEFHYTKAGKEDGKYYRLDPYRLLNKNGIWYLVGLSADDGGERTFCFSQIRAINEKAETFTPDETLLAKIDNSDSIYYGNQLAEIVIRVTAHAAPYFLRRSLLPNQELIRKLDDGGLLLACKNVNEMEVVPIVQYWIPHLSIISPADIQDKMLARLKRYLENN